MWKNSWHSGTKFLSLLADPSWYISQEFNLKAECCSDPVQQIIHWTKKPSGLLVLMLIFAHD
jgi:hypothetical protein